MTQTGSLRADRHWGRRRRSPGTAQSTPEGAWGRPRLLAALGLAVGVVLVLVVGLVYALLAATRSTDASPAPGDRPADNARRATAGDRRDEIAAAAMLQVPQSAARPTMPAAVPAETMEVPPATRVGPARVPSGFPHNAQGAVGQLAAIGTTVLQGMSIEQVNAVHAAWAMPGAADVAQWEMTRNVQAFLGAARMGAVKDATATVTARPVAAQIKGVDGTDWAVACVLLDVRAAIQTEARMGYGWCERMQWHDGRWQLAPGPAPAQAPSTWPGSESSIRAGWKTWSSTGTAETNAAEVRP